MPKKVLIALPPALLDRVDSACQLESRTRSDLIREALRRYVGMIATPDEISGQVIDLKPLKPAPKTETKTDSLPTYRTPAQIIDDANYPVSRLATAVSG